MIHARHVLDSEGQRRVWHSGHVLMALGMMFMYAPASLDHFNVPSGFWQLVFANASLAIVAWILYEAFARRAVNVLWLVMAIDLAAMAYMWSPSGFQAPLTWLLVGVLRGAVAAVGERPDAQRRSHDAVGWRHVRIARAARSRSAPPSRWCASATCACRCSR